MEENFWQNNDHFTRINSCGSGVQRVDVQWKTSHREFEVKNSNGDIFKVIAQLRERGYPPYYPMKAPFVWIMEKYPRNEETKMRLILEMEKFEYNDVRCFLGKQDEIRLEFIFTKDEFGIESGSMYVFTADLDIKDFGFVRF